MGTLPIRKIDPFEDYRRRTETVVITPEIAQRLLGKQDPNRPSSRTLVAAIAADITAGNWVHNGETVCISNTGRVLDGKHRLMAVVKAGKPITTEVAFGIDDDAFSTYDQGKKRCAGDVFAIAGEANATTLAAALGVMICEDEGNLQAAGSGTRFTVAQVSSALDRHPGMRAAVKRARGQYRTALNLLTPRIAAWCSYRFFQVDPNAAEAWFLGLDTGTNLEPGNPVLTLRNRLIDRSTAKAKLPAREVLALAIKAFNSLRKGQTIRYLRWRTDGPTPEPFPALD